MAIEKNSIGLRWPDFRSFFLFIPYILTGDTAESHTHTAIIVGLRFCIELAIG